MAIQRPLIRDPLDGRLKELAVGDVLPFAPTAILAADTVQNSTVTPANSGLFVTVEANKRYLIEAVLLGTSAVLSCGIQAGFFTGSGLLGISGGWWGRAPSSATAAAERIVPFQTNQGAVAAGLGIGAAGAVLPIFITGILKTGGSVSAPNHKIEVIYNTEIAGTNAWLLAGSFINLREY